jgi:hypothetical protein
VSPARFEMTSPREELLTLLVRVSTAIQSELNASPAIRLRKRSSVSTEAGQKARAPKYTTANRARAKETSWIAEKILMP